MSQATDVLDYIDRNGSITSMEAYDLGITRLASRIHDLRSIGIDIRSETVKGINRHGRVFHCARYWRNGNA